MYLEKKIKYHLYLFIVGLVLFSMFLAYVFIYEHKIHIKGSAFESAFREVGLSNEINDITHDDSMWYYKLASTCVGYGDKSSKCKKYESFCGGKNQNTYGNEYEQALAVKEAIENNGEHPLCPLIYPGAN